MNTDELLANVPPHSAEAEREVLAAILRDRSAALEVASLLRPSDFYRPAHEAIFAAAVELVRHSEPLDAVSLVEELRRRGALEQVGGAVAIAELASVLGANPRHHAGTVRGKARLRHALVVLEGARRSIFESRERPEEILEAVEASVFTATQDRGVKDARHVSEVLADVFRDLDRIDDVGAPVATGFFGLDDVLAGGFRPGELAIVAARPSIGKSTVLANLARNVVLPRPGIAPRGAVYFSLEMRDVELVQRVLSSVAGVEHERIRRRVVGSRERELLEGAAEQLEPTRLHVDFCPRATLLEIRAKARRLRSHRERPIDVVFVDYLGLMRGDDNGGRRPRYEVMSEITGGLKVLAGELEVPVIAAAQVNREAKHGERPRMEHLRDSGSLEQDADVVLMLHRDEDLPSVLEVVVEKNRNGRTGRASLGFARERCLLQDVEEARR